jgi:hypothetical protein
VATLAEVISRLDSIPAHDAFGISPTIFARKPWTIESDAMVLSEDAVDNVAPRAPEYAYLLEVDLAQEAIGVWSEWRAGVAPTVEQATLAVIHYAEHDAYQPLDDGWPDESGADGGP